MNVAAQFDQRVVVHSEQLPWVASPMPGVQRRLLDRVGDEVARATSIVRYAANSVFSPHIHSGGEEFIVLEGVFQDEHGDYPAGTYVRNPPHSKHKPGSQKGCIIFVKLWQFQPQDRYRMSVQTSSLKATSSLMHTGVLNTPLYKDDIEEVSLLTFEPYAEIKLKVNGGAELLVLQGSVQEHDDELCKYSWLRVPLNSQISAKAGEHGAKVWLKTGHLRDVERQIARVKAC